MNTQKVAVFDIDGTLFRSFLLEELIKELVTREVFPEKAINEYQLQRNEWILNHSDYRTYTDSVSRVFQMHIRGVDFKDFDSAATVVAERHRNFVYTYTRDLITNLSKNDYFLLAISTSPKGLLDKFCTFFGFDKVYGIFYELGPSDKFTGNITDEHIIGNKGNTLRRAVEKEGLSFDNSFGIGDSEDDIAFLELVERPVCFNPTRELYRHAKLNRWQIVVERKGMIYEMPI